MCSGWTPSHTRRPGTRCTPGMRTAAFSCLSSAQCCRIVFCTMCHFYELLSSVNSLPHVKFHISWAGFDEPQHKTDEGEPYRAEAIGKLLSFL
jgi:hypothetical protein